MNINKYWFKKNSKSNSLPVTWEGWMLSGFFIGFILQIHRFTDSIVVMFLASAVLCILYFKFVKSKTDPVTVFEKEKDRFTLKQFLGGFGGVLLFLVLFTGGLLLWTNYQHALTGSAVKLEGEKGWVEFHAKNDNFSVEVPVFPKYTRVEKNIPNTEFTIKVSTYVSKTSKNGSYLMSVTDLPKEGDYSDVEASFSNAILAMKNEFIRQTNEEPIITSSSDIFLSAPARSFVIEGINRSDKFVGKIFFLNNKLYLISFSGDKANFNSENYSRFTNSFKLKD